MKITSISYKKIFPIQQFVNETIGIEVQVDEGDNLDEVYKMAREQVHKWNDDYQIKIDLECYKAAMNGQYKPPTIDPPHVDEGNEWTNMAIDHIIANADSFEELSRIKKHVTKEFMPAYMKRMKELTPKSI